MTEDPKEPKSSDTAPENLDDEALDNVEGGGGFTALRGVRARTLKSGLTGVSIQSPAATAFNTAGSGAIDKLSQGIKGIDRLKK